MKGRESTWFTHASLGSWDPEGCLVCVIDDMVDAAQAAVALQRAGFLAEHMRLFVPAEAMAFSDALHHQGRLLRALYFLINLSDDARFEEEYRDEARRGHLILVLYAPHHARYTRALAVLRQYRAHTLRHYGQWIVRDFYDATPEP